MMPMCPPPPREIIHLPGKPGVPLSHIDPKAVVDALFPPLPPSKWAKNGGNNGAAAFGPPSGLSRLVHNKPCIPPPGPNGMPMPT